MRGQNKQETSFAPGAKKQAKPGKLKFATWAVSNLTEPSIRYIQYLDDIDILVSLQRCT
jgi:hypothetical protein